MLQSTADFSHLHRLDELISLLEIGLASPETEQGRDATQL